MKVAGRVWAPDRGGVAAGRATRVLLVGDPAGETNVLLANRWRDLGLAVEVVAGDEIPGTTTADVVLGRLDVLPSLDGVSPGLFRLLRIERRGAHILNGPFGLLAAHDKLLPARAKIQRVRHHPALPWQQMPAFMAELRARHGASAQTGHSFRELLFEFG